MFKAIALDIDGTITLKNGLISTKAILLIRRLESRGIRIVLASGNAFPVLMGLKKYFGCSGVVIAENGAVVGDDTQLIVNGDPEVGLKAKEAILSKLGDIVRESWQNRFRYVDFAFKLRKPSLSRSYVLNAMRRAVGDMPYTVVVDSGVAFHVRDIRVNKGVGLIKAAELMGLTPKDFVAIGDSEVDLEMFEVAGFSVALANAVKELKDRADMITEKPYWEGFNEAVEKIFNLK